MGKTKKPWPLPKSKKHFDWLVSIAAELVELTYILLASIWRNKSRGKLLGPFWVSKRGGALAKRHNCGEEWPLFPPLDAPNLVEESFFCGWGSFQFCNFTQNNIKLNDIKLTKQLQIFSMSGSSESSGLAILSVLGHWGERCQKSYHRDNWLVAAKRS